MSKIHDELQVLQGILEARRSGRTTLPITDTENEVRAMGSARGGEYPPVERAGLGDGYKMCVRNATRFLSGARALRDAGQCRNAHIMLTLALEELGSAIQLYEAGRSGVEDWDAWWRRYFTHPKKLESKVLELPRMEEIDARLTLVREELLHVDFDTDSESFVAPREDDDLDLRELLTREAAYVEAVLRAMPTHAFERWEIKDMVAQSPDIAPSVLYARIEEFLDQEPPVSERALLFAIARDLGRSPDDFTAGFERWKKLGPKARLYMGLLQRVQDRMKKEGGTEGTD